MGYRRSSHHRPRAPLGARERARKPCRRKASPLACQASRVPPCSFGEDYPLSAVDEFTCRVEVTGVACCLNDHMQEDLAQVVEPPAAKQVFRPPGRWAVKGSGGNDGVGEFYLPPVGVQHRGGCQVRRDLPCVIRLVIWHRLASNDSTEPEPLDVDRQM